MYQVTAGLADHFDDIDLGLSGPIPGFNTLSVDWPQVGFSADGKTLAALFLPPFRRRLISPPLHHAALQLWHLYWAHRLLRGPA